MRAIFTPIISEWEVADSLLQHSCERVEVLEHTGDIVRIRFKDGTETDAKAAMLQVLPDSDRYEAVYGPGTHQFWLYDNEDDVFIDPIEKVTKRLKWMINFGDCSAECYAKAEAHLLRIAAEDPDWIHDEAYRYENVEI